ncbi:ROK family protein [Nonomuraea cavernae]|nr:ROK family protein [Nonomuraea cavernae]MCA2186387.1 ROK family protein [Nonomuraea cavernae]
MRADRIVKNTNRPIELEQTTGVALGISVGLHGVRVAGRLVHEPKDDIQLMTVSQGISGGNGWVAETAEAVHTMTQSIGRHRADIATLGMAVPWAVHARTLLPSDPVPTWADTRPVGRLLAEALALPPGDRIQVVIDTDARLAAFYEQTYNHAFETMLSVQVSAHVTGGLMLANTHVRGARGRAVSVGHLSVDLAGRECWCGLRGCLEGYVTAPALLEEAFVKCHARQVAPPGTIEEFITRARDRDLVCLDVLRRAAVQLGRGLVSATVAADQHAIVLGGTVAPGFELVLDECRREMDRSGWAREVPVLIGELDAATHGALLLGLAGHLN